MSARCRATHKTDKIIQRPHLILSDRKNLITKDSLEWVSANGGKRFACIFAGLHRIREFFIRSSSCQATHAPRPYTLLALAEGKAPHESWRAASDLRGIAALRVPHNSGCSIDPSSACGATHPKNDVVALCTQTVAPVTMCALMAGDVVF